MIGNRDLVYKAYVFILITILSLLNYLVLYRNKYYEEVFSDFDKHTCRLLFSLAFWSWLTFEITVASETRTPSVLNAWSF